jgi:hypothetical protein
MQEYQASKLAVLAGLAGLLACLALLSSDTPQPGAEPVALEYKPPWEQPPPHFNRYRFARPDGARAQQLFERPAHADINADDWVIDGLLGDRLDGTRTPFVLPEDQEMRGTAAMSAAAALTMGKQQQLFERPEQADIDGDAWITQGLLGDRLDGTQNPFVLPEDQKVGPSAALSARTQSLLGGDDWLGAPLAVPEDVRDNGEQQIGEDVNYWMNHDGDIGTGHGGSLPPGDGYPY